MNTTYLVPFFLGTFSGFLATLPIGPAKIVAVRKFLLITKGNENEVSNFSSSNTILLASISGLILAQILFFLSLQFPFLYSLWVKPHFFSFFFVFILFIYLYQIKNIQFNVYNTQPFIKSELNFSYQQAAFLETLLLQLVNPVVFPNPIFCRLNNVFLFRYSTLIPFFAGNFLGLLSGYGTFFFCTLFLLKKLELDAPTIYRLAKIKIHQFFGIIFVIFSFICLSRTPLPAIKPFQLKATAPQLFFNTLWYENIWPDSFFGYDRWKRPLRIIAFDNKKSQPNDEIKPFNKMYFSQFFFEGCIKDGKYYLYHNFPKSLSIISQNINAILKSNSDFQNYPSDDCPHQWSSGPTGEGTIGVWEGFDNSFDNLQKKKLIDNWIQEKTNRQNKIYKNINITINQIERGTSLEELVEKKFSSFDNTKNKISKQLDPRLSADFREIKLFFKNKSFLLLTKENFSKKDSLVPKEDKNLTNIYTKNRLKLFFAENYYNVPHRKGEKGPFLTWQPVSEKNENLKEKFMQEKSLVLKQSDLNDLKRTTTWDEIFKKFSISVSSGSHLGQKLFNFQDVDDSVEKLRQEENIDWIQKENNARAAKLYKPIPLWNLNFNKKELDFIKRQSKTKPHLKTFFPKRDYLADRQNFISSEKPFFRRNEFPGTITSRRGKAVCWHTFQKKPHAPLFVNHFNLLKIFFEKRKKIQINQDVPTRSWQSTERLFQFFRDYLLSLQAYIRKYVKLPLLIILKNLVRQLFFQPAEWEKDWTNLSKELYVECDFYGKAVSTGVKLPNFLTHGEPKQIKIIKPFQLRFWTRSLSEKPSLQESENYSFLNVWGRETKMPFGKVKKSPSFWQLLIERIKLLLQYKIVKNLSLSTSLNTMNVQHPLTGDKVQSNYKVQRTPMLERVQDKYQKLKIDKTKNADGYSGKKENVKNMTSHFSEKNIKSTATKRKISNNSTQFKTFSHFNKKEKTNRIRRYTIKNIFLLFKKNWYNCYRFCLKKEREVFFSVKKNIFQLKKWFLRKNTKIVKNVTRFSYSIYRFLYRLCYQVYEFFSFILLQLTKTQKKHSLNLELFDLNPPDNLSQASILHNIWEDRMMSRPNITSLMKKWNQNDPLTNKVEEFLNKQGILGNEKPENLTENQWKEWLKNFRAFTPSLKLWALWAPNYWTQAVEQYWKNLPSSKVDSLLNQEPNKIAKKSRIDNSSYESLKNNTIPLNKFLEAHLPLFQAAQKQKKIWTFNLISRTYTEINNDGDVDSFYNWQNNEFDKKTHYLFDTLKKVKGKEKNLLINPTRVSSLPQLREKKFRRFDTQQDIRKELPLSQREKKRLDFDIKLQTLRQRGTFFPVSIKRWKLKKLKNKLEKLAKNVIKKPQGGELSSYFSNGEKNKKMIRELFQSETKLFANILENWNTKVLDDELLMYNTVSSILRFFNKNSNTSLLASGNQKDNSYDLSELFPRGKFNSLDLYFILLEDIYLPTHLHEIKILDCFNFTKETQNSPLRSSRQDILKLSQSNKKNQTHSFARKQKSVYTDTINKWRFILQQNHNVSYGTLWAFKDRQIIVRFLWPTHRLEDLGCINRFWMGTANQSRFSMLRLQTFPNYNIS